MNPQTPPLQQLLHSKCLPQAFTAETDTPAPPVLCSMGLPLISRAQIEVMPVTSPLYF